MANDSTYGHDITRTVADDGSVVTLVRQSLLRGPRFPDPEADQGPHTFTSVLGLAPTVRRGSRDRVPGQPPGAERPRRAGRRVAGDSRQPGRVVEAVKLAEDRSGDLVIRLYEALGGRAATTVTAGGSMDPGLDDRPPRALDDARSWTADDAVELSLKPFEIVTLRHAAAEPSESEPICTGLNARC